MISILGDRTANVDITRYHWPCNIDITKNRFYMAARIDKIIISELAATELIGTIIYLGFFFFASAMLLLEGT